MNPLLINLFPRWKDEEGCENFSEYEKVIREKAWLISGAVYIDATQRPFGFRFRIGETGYRIFIKPHGNTFTMRCEAIK